MNKSRIVSVGLKYGLSGALITVLVFLVLYFMDQNPLLVTRKIRFSIFLIPILVFFSIREFRDYKNNNELRFWQGLTVGFVNYLIIALISATFIVLFITNYDSQILQDYINFNLINTQEQREGFIETYDADTYEQLLRDIRNTTAYHIGLDEMIWNLLIGFISTFLMSMFLRK